VNKTSSFRSGAQRVGGLYSWEYTGCEPMSAPKVNGLGSRKPKTK